MGLPLDADVDRQEAALVIVRVEQGKAADARGPDRACLARYCWQIEGEIVSIAR